MRKRLENFRNAKIEWREMRRRVQTAQRELTDATSPGERTAAEKKLARLLALGDVLEREEEEIELLIYRLPDSTQRRVLLLRFVDGMSVTRVAQLLHYSERQIYNITDAAIAALELGNAQNS